MGQHSRLIPSDMLMVQAVSPNIYYRCKRDFQLVSRWRDPGKSSTEFDISLCHGGHLIRGYFTHSQSMRELWVHLNTNSSMTRSMPTERLMSSVSVSAGFWKMKWSR